MPDQQYEQRIKSILAELGIPRSFYTSTKMPLYEEAQQLHSIGNDVFGREQSLLGPVAELWRQMQMAARQDGIEIDVVSAFRSVDYQKQLIQRKINKGMSIEEILQINTPPGYSEHHTGRALDITTPGCEPLVEAFERTDAYKWLSTNAGNHLFSLSYPRHNPHGIIFEPWHWAVSADRLAS